MCSLPGIGLWDIRDQRQLLLRANDCWVVKIAFALHVYLERQTPKMTDRISAVLKLFGLVNSILPNVWPYHGLSITTDLSLVTRDGNERFRDL